MDGPLKWHGGKSYLAKKIVEKMPPRCKNPNAPAPDDDGWLHYVEPYAGGLSVLLENDPTGISEVVNDLNGALTNFWRVLQDSAAFTALRICLEATPFSKAEFNQACKWLETRRNMVVKEWNFIDLEFAHTFFIVCRQSLSGRMDSFAGITRNRTRRGMNEQVSAWLNCIEGLPDVHERLKRVLILNDPALTVIKKEAGPRTLFYLDPPYLHETRSTTGEYEFEMADADHADLLAALTDIKGRFMLSGYHSKMYDNHAKKAGWKCHEFDLPNNSAGGKTKRRMVECLWCNF